VIITLDTMHFFWIQCIFFGCVILFFVAGKGGGHEITSSSWRVEGIGNKFRVQGRGREPPLSFVTKGGSWGWWPDSNGVSSMAANEVVGCHQTSNGGHHVGEIGSEGEIRVNHDLLPCYITLNESIF
jgi:hypothetical protein